MFRYVIVLLLINAYSRSLGVPLPKNASHISLSESLNALASRCENSVLSSLIKSKIVDCNVFVPPYTQKQFECLIFIDINNQLCDAVISSKLLVSEELTAKINESVEVEKFCSIASKWNVTNITEFPLYKNTIETVFHNAQACSRVCGVEDVLSQDTNFYCKYYKWGSDMLNQQQQASTTATQTSNISAASGKNVALGAVSSSAEKDNDIKIVPDPPNTANLGEASKISNPSPNDLHSDVPEVKPTLDKEETPAKSESTSVVSSTKGQPIVPPNEQENNIGSNTEAKIKQEQALNAPSNSGLSNEGIDRPSGAEIQPVKTEDVGKIEKPLDIHTNVKDAVLEKAKIQGDPDEYQDTEEGNEGLPDLKADDAEDPAGGMMAELDTKPDLVPPKDDIKKNISPITSFNGEREFFPNAMQDASFSDDDDHFFPFFLTAVILVVLLYVLYHNKNKVSKVVLGLIVEGRQPGRRRNSRGHSYRRLDTLEQAMSTNTAAPPSKIIY